MHYYRLRNTGSTELAPRVTASCAVAGCPAPIKPRGMCGRHYQQVRNSGAVQPDDGRPPAERFWSRVDQTGGPDTCWPWTGSTTKGYGNVRLGGVSYRAHRLAWIYAHGAIPVGREVDHRCHDSSCRLGDLCPHRRCCNPRHLKVVEHAENMAPDRSSLGSLAGARQRAKSHCPRGHAYTAANTYVSSQGYRRCRA